MITDANNADKGLSSFYLCEVCIPPKLCSLAED